MKLDGPSRSVLSLLAVAFLVLGFLSGHLLELLAYRLSTAGLVATRRPDPALLLVAVVAMGSLWALRSLACHLGATRRLTERMTALRVPEPPSLTAAADGVGLTGRLDVVTGRQPFSFTYGLLAPRVVVTTGLLEILSVDEIEAVLEHERYHVDNLDPLKAVLADVAAQGLFYLPALRDLRRRYLGGRELAADRRALRRCGPRSLAGALRKVVDAPRWAGGAAAASLGGAQLLEARVAQIETSRPQPVAAVSRRALALTVPGLVLLAEAVAAAVAALGGVAPVVRSSLRMPDAHSAGLLGASLCAGFWAWAGWRAYRRLFRRPGVASTTDA